MFNAQKSYWLETSNPQTFPKLTEEISTDVAIIGGGIAGLTAAYILQESGLKVAVIEKHTLASGTTGKTTGKVTTQHGLIYAELMQKFGQKKAKIYADSYKAAMQNIQDLIQKEHIDCGWTPQDNFVYTADASKIATFQKEAQAAASLGLPATFETNVQLPFSTKAAVKFANQAYFNAAAYTQELAKLVNKKGGAVYEHTQAKHIADGTPCKVTTQKGSIHAKHVIVATKIPPFPLVARFTYALDEFPHTSYIVAGKPDALLQGMYISPDKNHYSLLPISTKQGSLLLVGGENHIPGLGNPAKRYPKLASYAQQWFGVAEVQYKWRAMDYIAYDNLPIVGRLYPWSKHVFVATGFKKWGLSTSMVAATVLRDLIHQQRTPAADLFDPHRVSAPLAMPKRLAKEVQRMFA